MLDTVYARRRGGARREPKGRSALKQVASLPCPQRTIRVLSPDDFAEWDRFVASVPEGAIYHSTTWLAPVCAAAGDALTILGCFEGDRLVGGIPFQTRRKGFFSLCRRAYATPYGGMLVAEGVRTDAVARELARLLERRYSHVCLTFSPFARFAAPPGPGWRRSVSHTYLHDIRDPGAFWDRAASEVRNRIRKAGKAGIRVRVNAAPGPFHAMYRDMFARMGKRIPIEADAFSRLIARLTETGAGRTYTAEMPGGAAAAACLVLCDRHRAYYSLAASEESLKRTGAPSLLIWYMVNDLSGVVPAFDFGGANVAAVAQFKSKFRGELVAYPEYSHYRSAIEWAAITGRERLHRLQEGRRAPGVSLP